MIVLQTDRLVLRLMELGDSIGMCGLLKRDSLPDADVVRLFATEGP